MKHLLAVMLLIFSVAFNVFQQSSTVSPQLMSLIDVERSFARLSVEKGVQASFLAWFADDGIIFQPHPVNLKESWGGRPAPKEPPPTVLNWAPIYGDISMAGDLGYSTGPFVIVDRSPQKRPPQHGVFFSIWKKQKDGNWRVVVDLGVQLEGAFAPLDAEYRRAPVAARKHPLPRDKALAGMLEAEGYFLESARSGAEKAWSECLSSHARIYRPGRMPVNGSAELKSWVGQQNDQLTGKTLKSDVSASGDLGYTVGSYEIPAQNITGYYVRVWRLDDNAKWKIVFDLTNVTPKG